MECANAMQPCPLWHMGSLTSHPIKEHPMRLVATIAASATLSVLAGLPLGAADMDLSDLRLGLGFVGFQDDNLHSLDLSGIGRHADRNWRGQLQYLGGTLGSAGGLIWGAGVSVNHISWDAGAEQVHAMTPTVDVLVGYGYAFTSHVHMELTPFAGYGRAYYGRDDEGSLHTSSDWDQYLEYGAKLGAYVVMESRLQLGLEIPFLVGRTNPAFTYDDSNGNPSVMIDEKRRSQGLGLLVTAGYRF